MPDSISRRYIFMPATVISAYQHNAEHDLFVSAINDLYAKIDPLDASKVSLSPFSHLSLSSFLPVAHNSDGTVKSEGVSLHPFSHLSLSSFLPVAHNSDGTVRGEKVALQPFSSYNLRAFLEKGHFPDGSPKAVASYYTLDLTGKLLMFFFGGD